MQASGRIISTDANAELFWLTPEQGVMLAHEEDSPYWMAAHANNMVAAAKKIEDLETCFKTGKGFKYDAYGAGMSCGVCRFLRIWMCHRMLDELKTIEGVRCALARIVL